MISRLPLLRDYLELYEDYLLLPYFLILAHKVNNIFANNDDVNAEISLICDKLNKVNRFFAH